MSLSRKSRRRACAGSLEEAGGLRRETEVGFAQMQLSGIVISSISVSIFLALCSIWRIGDRRRDCELSCDLL